MKQNHKMIYKNKNCLKCNKKYSPNSPIQKYCSKCKAIKEKEWSKKSYEKNKEKIKENSKKYYEKNKNNPKFKLKEKIRREKYYVKNKEKIKKDREENKEKMKEYKKEHYQKNKEKINRKHRKYYQENKNKWRLTGKKRERKKAYDKKKHKKDYQKNKNLIKKRCKEYYHIPEVKKKVKEYQKQCREENKKNENKRRKKLRLPLIGEGFKSEMELLVYVHHLFGNYDILTHHRKPLLDWTPLGLELDIYLPELKLAFEYMGIQHYEFREFLHTKEEFKAQQYRDRCKKKICKLKGITLIKIKYDEKLSEQLILSKLKHIPHLVSIQRTLQ